MKSPTSHSLMEKTEATVRQMYLGRIAELRRTEPELMQNYVGKPVAALSLAASGVVLEYPFSAGRKFVAECAIGVGWPFDWEPAPVTKKEQAKTVKIAGANEAVRSLLFGETDLAAIGQEAFGLRVADTESEYSVHSRVWLRTQVLYADGLVSQVRDQRNLLRPAFIFNALEHSLNGRETPEFLAAYLVDAQERRSAILGLVERMRDEDIPQSLIKTNMENVAILEQRISSVR